MKELNFYERSNVAKNEVSKALLLKMHKKQSNLCLAADFTKLDDLIKVYFFIWNSIILFNKFNKLLIVLKAADELGPYICILKTHVDIIEDFEPVKFKELLNIAVKHDFLIFEDRKFADIGNTVKSQFHGGIYQISSWADIFNAHPIAGPDSIKALKVNN